MSRGTPISKFIEQLLRLKKGQELTMFPQSFIIYFVLIEEQIKKLLYKKSNELVKLYS